jgi:hypothetical protein
VAAPKLLAIAKKMRIVLRRIANCVIVMTTLIHFVSQALSQDTGQVTDAGQMNFIANCAECHGADGKGGGPRSAELSTKPADLTLLAKKNNGIFDPGPVFQMIDGRESGNRAHVSKEMPIWGCRHQSSPFVRRRVPRHQRYLPPPVVHKHDESTTVEALTDLPCDSELTAQERILSIVGYLSRIQQ